MKITVLRYSSDTDSTLGIVFINGKFQCYSLEDEFREVKVKGETRIPKGVYTLGVQENLTPLTKKYLDRHDFFERHLHVKNVPNFTGIYIHLGNTDEHTDGCLLLGNEVNNNRLKAGRLNDSVSAYKEFYLKVYPEAKKGNCTIEYIDHA